MAAEKLKVIKQHRYPWAVIETAVQLHLGEGLTYRSVSDTLENLGVNVSHKTVYEWVQKFGADVKTSNRRKKSILSLEESEVTCNGEEFVMYRAVDSRKATLGVYLSKSKNSRAAKSALKKTFEA